jgi:hypothetical protein
VEGLIPDKVYDDLLECIMRFGAPAHYNEHGSREQFLEYRDDGNHKSIQQKPAAFHKAINKEDKCNCILTFPSYIKDFIPNLWLNPNPRKEGPSHFQCIIPHPCLQLLVQQVVSNKYEPDIILGGAWNQYLWQIYNLRISYPNKEILLFDDDVISAFHQVKYHPNVLSRKIIATTSICSSQQDLPLATRQALQVLNHLLQLGWLWPQSSTRMTRMPSPTYDDYLDAVQFAPPPSDDVHFIPTPPTVSTEVSSMQMVTQHHLNTTCTLTIFSMLK